MSDEVIEALLEKLGRGDDSAAEHVFLAYEPYLRMVVRQRLTPRLRAKFDSIDVVQSVWVDVLRGFRVAGWRFADAGHLRAFLVRATLNRFIDRLRQNRSAIDREQPMAEVGPGEIPGSGIPRPSECAQAEDLWRQLLELCPPQHREILQLKREGVPLAEIVSRTGLHEGSVHRILAHLARKLAERRRNQRAALIPDR